jgi:hypothetical protein
MDEEWERIIVRTIQGFPEPESDTILDLWYDWLASFPDEPYYKSWEEFTSLRDDPATLYSETRIYIKRVRNEIRDLEVPKSNRQRIVKALAAVASVFVVIFMAISRLFRASE